MPEAQTKPRGAVKVRTIRLGDGRRVTVYVIPKTRTPKGRR